MTPMILRCAASVALLSASALPCLAGGAKAFRLKRKPDTDDWLAALRALELKKAPSIAETLDWARGLCALGVKELDPATVRRTLALVVKHEDDLRKVEGKVGAMLGAGSSR